jgi:Mycothiol-dependent nitroreductase Rv2466c
MVASISVFVDPACPWAWITSRWLTEVAPKRELTIRWRSFSPGVRDGGVQLTPRIPEQFRQAALQRRMVGAVALRVFEWLRDQVGEPAVGRFYTQLGYRLNDPDRPGGSPMPGIIRAALTAAGLDQGAETAASDPIWQHRVVRSTQEAMAIVGRDAMTPVIAVETDPPAALSGPIVSPAPAGADALRLWDAVAVLLQSPAFLEARRARSLPRFPRPVE